MKNITLLLASFMCLFFVSMSYSQNVFIKIDGIPGDANDSGHKDWIIIDSFSQGLGQKKDSRAVARRTGIVILEDLVITKKIDKSTTKLIEACSKGKVLPKLEMEVFNKAGEVYYKLTLENVIISSVSTISTCDPECDLKEEVAFSYSKVKWDYISRDGQAHTTSYNKKTGN